MEYKMNKPLISKNSTTTKSPNSGPSSNMPKLSLVQVEAEMARRNLEEFVRQAWLIVEPSAEFIDCLAIKAICYHLQAVTEGRIAHLIINIPPGHAKSLLTAVFWPAWVWIRHPEARFLLVHLGRLQEARQE